MFWANTPFEQGYTIPNVSHPSSPENAAALIGQVRMVQALQRAAAESCKEHMDVEDLRYMGTATVVRDMDFMTKLLDGEDAKM
jgi:hypothetical protein